MKIVDGARRGIRRCHRKGRDGLVAVRHEGRQGPFFLAFLAEKSYNKNKDSKETRCQSLSDKDTITKEYMSQPKQFADLFNGYCYNGEEVIRPENLRELDTTSIVLPYGADGAVSPQQKDRDVLKMLLKTDGKAAYCILGVENQSEIHTAMPVRNLLYDAMTLAKQVDQAAKSYREAKDTGKDTAEFLSGFHRGDKVLPVVTIVVHWGTDKWDVPLTLREMYPEDISPQLMKYVADYKVNLVSPSLMSDEELDLFKSDLKEVLKFIKHSADKHELKKLLDDNPGYQDIKRLAAQTISVCSNVKFDIPVGKEAVNVCKAIEDMKMDARNEGRSEGRNEGLNEGISKAVTMLKDLQLTKDAAIQQIMKNYSLPDKEAAALVNSNW